MLARKAVSKQATAGTPGSSAVTASSAASDLGWQRGEVGQDPQLPPHRADDQDRPENREAMIRAGVPAAVAEMNAQAFSLTADGDAEWVTDDGPAVLGRPARSFGQFAADYATAVLSSRDPGAWGGDAGAPSTERAEAKAPVCGCRRTSPPLPRPCRAPRWSCAVAAARAGCVTPAPGPTDECHPGAHG
jgi:hypothetical protein